MTKRYYSAKGNILLISIIFMLLLLVMSFLDKIYPVFIIVFLATAFMIWMWFDTYYVIENDQLFYRSALIKGSISIAAIVEIVRNEKQYKYSGIKPALSMKGIVIKYNRWDDIYISPKDADQFINELKKINPDIKVTG